MGLYLRSLSPHITMIVPPALQDVPEIMRLDSSASSSARDNGGEHPTASSSSSSFKETPSREKGMGDVVSNVSDRPVIEEWESRTIAGRLRNLTKAPKDLPAGFRFKAALHHEVADCAPSISGYRKLEEMVRAHHIPKMILLRTGAKSERACTLTLNSIRFIIGFMLLCARLEVLAKAIVFRSLFQCRLCPNSRGSKWYYLSRRDKSQLFKNVRNKVARWKRQFFFVCDTRTERNSNDLATRLSEWRTSNAHVNYPQLLPRDVDLKNQLLEYAKRENLIDLEALVTSEHLAVFGFVDVTNLFSEGEMSSILEHQHIAPSARRRVREEIESEDEVPLIRWRTRGGAQPAQAVRLAAACSPNAPSTTARVAAKPTSASASVSGPRIAYPEGFSYVRAECQPAMVQGMHSFVPHADSKRAKAFVQQHGDQVAMIKLMDAFSYAVALYESEHGACTENSELSSKCKQLAAEKASLVGDVNRLQGSEMANRAAAAESRVDELANKNNELREELERARAERKSGIQAAKEEATRAAEVDRNLIAAGQALNELKTSHARFVSIAQAQGAKWFVGSASFQDAVAVASANVTTEIYNELRGKVLQHRPDFLIGELAFFDGEDLDEQGKSLAPLVDATVRLRWDLNEEGVPVWPPQVLEDGEDPARLPSFDAWVEGAPVAEREPSSTPPNSQPAVEPASSPVNAPTFEPTARSPPARSSAAAVDASIPVNLTDD
ncbi:hypothetical protein SLEP1_g12424 [Rubroshorea leprosula]|uniref:Transposase (Putative), gypsy type n=1 Tax=Rubroshorea leprosula TaxID=152421 RepID=A0AAV5IGZ3_9ROSI|nr:hypothetical protein SLEP1_g12424 [Rubroshorea leprosula]